MATVLRQITDRVDAVVQASVPSGTKVARDRADAISRDEAPLVNQRWSQVITEAFSDDVDQHYFELELHIHVRAEPMTPAAEDIHGPVHAALTADATLRTLALSFRVVEQSADLAEADLTAGRKSVRYRVKFLTPRNAL